jgi:oxygen-independent coproporphyrinogen-3 oxidase
MKTSGIYIHIPFCIAKCIYCDFYSVVDQEDHINDFVYNLNKEIKNIKINENDWKFDSIYLGGGTPSLLNPFQLESILSVLQKKVDISKIVEFTLEANPGEFSPKKLEDFRALGVNRVSIGIQSFNDKYLHFLTRIHTSKEAINSFRFARDAGFENINCDLIYNIPDQSIIDWEIDLKQLIKLNPEHISAYSLTIEKGTVLYDLIKNGSIKMPNDETFNKLYTTTTRILKNNGYEQYEISNFAKQGKESKHNFHYWNHDRYIGFGPSAHSFDGKKRWNNYNNLEQYNLFLENGKSPIEAFDYIDENNMINEIVGFGLRMTKGIAFSKIPKNKIKDLKLRIENIMNKYPGMIIVDHEKLRLNQKGMQFADSIAVELML